MWDYFYTKRASYLGYPHEMTASAFAFSRLPPRATPPLGISNVGKIKDAIIHDKDLTMNRLNNHHEMFQQYAMGLFNLTPNHFQPGHPMHKQTHQIDVLQEENERLKKENAVLKNDKNKEKKI